MKIITTCTTLTNTIYVEDEMVEGLAEEDIIAMMKNNPEEFGIDNNPHIEADVFVSLTDAAEGEV